VNVACRSFFAALSFMLFVATASSVEAQSGGLPQAQRDLQVEGVYLDTVTGDWTNEQPDYAAKPTLAELAAGLGHVPEDFGLAFSCWVQPSGALRDCRTTMVAPNDRDGTALMRAIAPHLRLTKEDAQRAIAKEYRLSVHAGLESRNESGMPLSCLPPYCVAENQPPPPPPAQAKDPLIRERVKLANECFSAAWDKSDDLRFAADKAVRENEQQPPPQSVRTAVLNYVNARTELKKCMAMVQDTAHLPSISPEDRKAVDGVLNWMNANYSGQTRFEVAILIGLIDKRTGEEQLSFPGEWP
jgi:hypothetical protein